MTATRTQKYGSADLMYAAMHYAIALEITYALGETSDEIDSMMETYERDVRAVGQREEFFNLVRKYSGATPQARYDGSWQN